VSAYVYQPTERAADPVAAMAMLRNAGHRLVEGGIDNASPGRVARILQLGGEAGLPFGLTTIDRAGFDSYVSRANYRTTYRDYYTGNQVEKSLEHYVTLKLLGVDRQDVFVDLASEHSPVPDIYRALTGCKSFRQDIMYPAGIAGDRIGGDAASMPVPDGFFTKAALTCSLEHFEQDADIRLFEELGRVLRPGGKVCVAPYYVYEEAAVQTDPLVSGPAKVPFDRDVPVFCAVGWNNRHGRFYSPKSMQERLISRVGDRFSFEFHHFPNAHEIDASVYLRFAFVATRQ